MSAEPSTRDLYLANQQAMAQQDEVLFQMESSFGRLNQTASAINQEVDTQNTGLLSVGGLMDQEAQDIRSARQSMTQALETTSMRSLWLMLMGACLLFIMVIVLKELLE